VRRSARPTSTSTSISGSGREPAVRIRGRSSNLEREVRQLQRANEIFESGKCVFRGGAGPNFRASRVHRFKPWLIRGEAGARWRLSRRAAIGRLGSISSLLNITLFAVKRPRSYVN
jgi:hypothetical protein